MGSTNKGHASAIPGEPGQWTLPRLAANRASASPDAVFVKEVGGAEESYAQFWTQAQALANYLLRIGVKPGDRVVIFASNSIPALHAWLAAGLVGAVDVSVNTGFRGRSLSHVLTVSEPGVIISDIDLLPFVAELEDYFSCLHHLITIGNPGPGGFDLAASSLGHVQWCDYDDAIKREKLPDMELPEVQPSHAATVVFTSGTTGPAKGVTMPHAQVCLLAIQTMAEARMSESDVFYSAHPLFHIAGKFMGVLAIFAAGGVLILDKKFDSEHWLDRVRQFRATISIAHGPMIEMIHARKPSAADRDHAISRLLCCPLPQGIGREFQSRFGLKGIEMWGMSEIGCPCWTSRQTFPVARSCGRVLTEWYEVTILDPDTDWPVSDGKVGEIAVRPKYPWTTMLGYMGMPKETAESWRNLWFHTGDMAFRDDNGNLFFVDRKGDRIRRRAENISSYDIECAAAEHPGVKECAAIGIPSGYEFDDDILLYIVPLGNEEIEPPALLRTLAQKIPHFMVPRYVEIVSELPRTLTNKLRKKELRDRGLNPRTWDRKAAGMSLRSLMETAKRN